MPARSRDAARLLAQAKRPLIVTANAGRDPAAFAALAAFAERFAIPVVQHRPRYLSLPSSHPMNLGFDPARLVPKADAILVIECDVPWIREPALRPPRLQGHPLRARSPVHALPDPRLSLRRRDHRQAHLATLSALTAALADAA